MSEQIIIDRRFRGPPTTANGGYACGIVAGLIGGTAEVTLRLPPPIDKPLDVRRHDGGRVALVDGERVVAEGILTTLEIEIPEPVSFSNAEEAAKSFPWFEGHTFPMCFVCGPDRAEGDGLRVFPGPVAGRDIVAAPWVPDASVADDEGMVRPEILWAVLDCPSGFAVFDPLTVALLGRFTAKIIAPVKSGERCALIGWQLGAEGRKLYAGSALYSHAGTLHAYAKATWIKIETPRYSKTA